MCIRRAEPGRRSSRNELGHQERQGLEWQQQWRQQRQYEWRGRILIIGNVRIIGIVIGIVVRIERKLHKRKRRNVERREWIDFGLGRIDFIIFGLHEWWRLVLFIERHVGLHEWWRLVLFIERHVGLGRLVLFIERHVRLRRIVVELFRDERLREQQQLGRNVFIFRRLTRGSQQLTSTGRGPLAVGMTCG